MVTHTGFCIHSRPYFHAPSGAVKTHAENINGMAHICTLATIRNNTFHEVLRHIFTHLLAHIYVDIMHRSQIVSPTSWSTPRSAFVILVKAHCLAHCTPLLQVPPLLPWCATGSSSTFAHVVRHVSVPLSVDICGRVPWIWWKRSPFCVVRTLLL